MMKKTYIHPTMETVQTEVQPLLALSGDQPHNEVNDNETFGHGTSDDWDE